MTPTEKVLRTQLSAYIKGTAHMNDGHGLIIPRSLGKLLKAMGRS